MPRVSASAVVRATGASAPRTEPAGRVYLDNHASTPVDPRIRDVVIRHMDETVGNASSADHAFGDDAADVVDRAAAEVASLVGADPRDVVFTSGATEAINIALQGFARCAARRLRRVPRIAVGAVEHRAVLDTARALAADGRVALEELPVDSCARLDLDALRDAGRRGLDLMCVMGANNEVGTVYDVTAVGRIAAAAGAAFLCDGTQSVGKVPLKVLETGVAFLALSAHKIYGPKGVGALVLNGDYPLDPVTFGGGHQRGLRPGTLNVAGIAGLGEACRLRRLEMTADEPRIAELRDHLQERLAREVPGLVVNGAQEARLAGNLHVSVPGVPNQAIVARVRDRLAIATGAACSSGIEAPSHVLRGMRLSREVQEGALRLGLGKFTTATDVDTAASLLVAAVRETSRALGP